MWQQVNVPLTDFGVLANSAVVDAFRVRVVAAEGKSPKWYLDDIQLEETGTPIEYRVEPTMGTWLRVTGFNIVMADAFVNTVANASSPNIPYDGFLGVSGLAAGIIYRRVVNEEVVSSASIKTFLDLMSFSQAEVTGHGGNGTNTWVSIHIEFSEEVILKSYTSDYMSLTLSEDLSGLDVFRMSASAKVETR